MKNPKIRVHLADDDYFLRLGLESLLAPNPDMELEQVTDNGHHAVVAALEKKPDIVLMEANLRNVCSLESVQQITAASHGTKVVMLSSNHDVETMSKARMAGAFSYLAKSSISTDLGAALRMIHSGIVIFSKPTDADYFPPHSESKFDLKSQIMRQIGPRDRRIIQALSAGYTNAQIATQLHVSEGTIKAQLAKIMVPLGINNRVQLAVLAVQAGLLEESRVSVPLNAGLSRHTTPRA